MAKQIDPRLSFKNTTDYSNFLFAQNNPLWPNAQANFNPFRYLCITQITNISRGEYTQAAQRGDACLKWFFDLLAGAFNCFWWVDSNYKIHVEHISYFDNGGSYTEGTQSVGKDLTALYDSRNSKAWSFGLGECKFETEDIASRYEYEWAMGATEVFNGNAIEILSRNIDKGKKEEVSISHFATDLDYIIGNPSSFSNDGWILLAPVLPSANATLATPVGQVNFNNYKQKDGTTYRIYVNNPYLSFAYLQQTVLTYGMPASAIICNGVITTAKSVARLMTQQVTVPYEDNEIEEGKLIRTSVGDGQIKRAEFDLESRCAKITLKYFTN